MAGKWVWPACGVVALAVLTPFMSTHTSGATSTDELRAPPPAAEAASADLPAVATTDPPAADVPQRELWVWHPDGDLVDLAQSAGVTRLLVWVSPGFTKDHAVLDAVTTIAASAHASGIAVDALCGDPYWVLKPALAASWAREAARSGLFGRLHLDIEPHALPEWSDQRDALAAGLITAIHKARSAGLPVDVDIPAWYHTIPTAHGALDAAVMRISDGVVIMAYRDSADAVMTQAAPELTTAARVGVGARVGINLGSPGTDPPFTSFQGQSPQQIWSAVTAIEAAGSAYPAWTGLALHDYGALRGLTATG